MRTGAILSVAFTYSGKPGESQSQEGKNLAKVRQMGFNQTTFFCRNMTFKSMLAGLRESMGALWWYSALLFFGARIGDLMNFYLGTFYLPHALPPAELGAVEPLMRLTALGALPLTVTGVVGVKYISTYLATGAVGKLKHLLRDLSLLALGAAALFMAVIVVIFEGIRIRLGIAIPYLLPGVIGLAIITCWQPMLTIVFQGAQRFKVSLITGLIGTTARLLLALALVPVFSLPGYLFATLLGGLLAIALGLWSLRDLLAVNIDRESYYGDLRAMLTFAVPVAIYLAAAAFQGFIEPFVIKHRLPVEDAAGYFIVCRFGFIPVFMAGAINYVIFPLLSHRHERGEETESHLGQAMVVSAVISVTVAITVGVSADWLFTLRPDWAKYQDYTPLAMRVAMTAAIDALIGIYALHEIACKKFAFVWLVAMVVALESLILYCSFGWSVFRGIVPAGIWQLVNGYLPNSLNYVVNVGIIARVMLGVALCLQWIWRRITRTA